MIRNKVRVNLLLEKDCSQDEGETAVSWSPINFDVYSDLFPDIIILAVDEWLSENRIEYDVLYEIIFAHCIEHDGGGAVVGEYFDPIYNECQEL